MCVKHSSAGHDHRSPRPPSCDQWTCTVVKAESHKACSFFLFFREATITHQPVKVVNHWGKGCWPQCGSSFQSRLQLKYQNNAKFQRKFFRLKMEDLGMRSFGGKHSHLGLQQRSTLMPLMISLLVIFSISWFVVWTIKCHKSGDVIVFKRSRP